MSNLNFKISFDSKDFELRCKELRDQIERILKSSANVSNELSKIIDRTNDRLHDLYETREIQLSSLADGFSKLDEKIKEHGQRFARIVFTNQTALANSLDKIQLKIDTYRRNIERLTISTNVSSNHRNSDISLLTRSEEDFLKGLKKLNDDAELAILKEVDRQMKDFEAMRAFLKAQGRQAPLWDREKHLDTKPINEIKHAYGELLNLYTQNYILQRIDNESAALTSFLREYGNYQQQRLAIAQEYAKKIADAETEGERQSLRRQEQDATSNLAFQRFKDSINWDEVFGDIDALSLEHLEELNVELKKLLDDSTLSATDYKTVCDQINNIEGEIIQRQNEWKKGLGLTINELERRKRLQQESARAQADLATAEQRYQDAVKKANEVRQSIKLTTGIEIDAKDITLENADEILAKFDPSSTAYKLLRSMFDNLADSDHELEDATNGLNKATGKAAAAADKAKTSFTDALNLINEISTKVNANIQSMTDLVGQLGLEDTAFGKGVTDFANAAQSATDAFSALQSGNYIGALANSLKSLGSLGNALGSFGIAGMGDSDKTLAEDMERLTESNEALRYSVEALTDELGEASFSDAEQVYKQMQANLAQSEANTQEQLRRMGAAYNNGFLGIGGKSSSNHKINEGVNSSEWQRISQIVGRSVTSAGEFWTLTSEQMHKVAKDAPDVYAHIKQLADEGYQDAAQYMDDYIGYWRELEEAAEAYAEKLTGVSLDSVEEDFNSMLSDLDSDSADFADNFEDYLREAIIGALVADQYKPMIEKWYENFRKAAETDGIDKAEQDALRREWDEITQQALKDREMLRDQFGWGSTGEGSGAYKAVSTFTQEQGDELNGRLTALQIGQERGNRSLDAAITHLKGLTVVASAQGTALNEMRNLLLIGNGHLEDIARYTKIASQYGDAITSIAEKIKTL